MDYKKVYVLMSAYNGEKYISQQIDSVLQQEKVNIYIYIRDDGSTDNTLNILRMYEQKYNNIVIFEGKNIGVRNSFLELIQSVDNKADYYALCDQDDYWLKNKLFSAIEKLNVEKKSIPLLYYSHTKLVDEKLQPLSIKNIYNKNYKYTFGQILIKNCASGCTMVFNPILKRLINKVNVESLGITPLHDHWIYMICLGTGGKVCFDDNSYILYRQHSHNVIGGKRTVIKKIQESPFVSKSCIRSEWAKQLYDKYYDDLSKEAIENLELIINYKMSFKSRLKLAFSREIKPKELLEKLIIFFTVLMKGY